MNRLLLLATITSAGCLRADGAFHCSTSMDCVTSTSAGTCQATGYCSFPDGDCPNGRYGTLSGTLSGQCVGEQADGGVDGRPDGRPIDGTEATTPVLVGTPAFASTGANSSLTFPMTIPPGSKRFLIVSLEISASMTLSPSVSTVFYGAHAMTLIQSVVGADDMTNTTSQQWQLIAPPVGNDNVVVTMAAPGVDLHANAMAFANVNQTTPVRDIESQYGDAASSTVSVTSDANDLVETTTGQGTSITGIVSPGMIEFLDNGDGSTSLNNAAGATQPGANGAASVTWAYGGGDIWQTIVASLEP